MGVGNTSGFVKRQTPLRIFIVDDDRDTRELIEAIFSKDGFECRSADGGADAMRVLGSYVPDVIISDLSMPDEDGYALMARIRSLSNAFATVPAIALTALTGAHHRQAVFESGFDAFLVKPAHPTTLIEVVTRLALASRAEVAS
ncbi:MAG: response regulator [Polyangiaceae bacterium]